ncbi:MAG TPA: hypothetical protein VLA74_01235, partial [Nitrososphaeraceae archaeon]|nr:hypothetical protein [Nitrososphaeraceae archaeon]
IPIYTSPTQHPGNSTIRDIYHPLFDKFGVDLVFSSDNHNYQRTFPINFNGNGDSSDNPIITNTDSTSYNIDSGVIYLIVGTGGRSLYEIEEQAPFVANQYDKQFGFLNIDIYADKALRGTFYINEDNNPKYYPISNTNDNIADHFIISDMKVSGVIS